jgi:tetratricopeptide (TPR) repeat protein
MALGDALSKLGHFANASEVFREALHWAEGNWDRQKADGIRLALARSLLTQARFAEIADLAQQVLGEDGKREMQGTLSGPRRVAVRNAEMVWGTALSLEGSDLGEAAEHLRAAEALSLAEGDLPSLAQARFELGSVLAQQGDLRSAVDLYRQSLEASSQVEGDQALEQRILAYNNLAYHLLLLGDPGAREPAETGLALAKEKGITGLQPYLYSTLGEIALSAGDLDGAEDSFNRGLEIAERLDIPERIAGLTANLGLVARQRGQASLAIHRLSTALGQANALGTHHLAAQIRLWLVPLLPPSEGRVLLAEARRMAEQSGRRRLLEEALRLEKTIGCGG